MVPQQPQLWVLGALAALAAWWLARRRRDDGELRRELADAHLLSHHFGFDELTWNHISCRLGESEEFIVTSGRELSEEVTPQSLVVSSSANANVTADVIHRAVYRSRPDIGAVVHHHTAAVSAVGVLKDGLRLLVQASAGFEDRVAYYPWEGISDDYDECSRIANALGPKCHTLIMRNHGALTVGRTLAEAWVRYYYLERSAKVQLLALSTGSNILDPPQDVLHKAAGMYNPRNNNSNESHHNNDKTTNSVSFAPGDAEWAALRRLADRLRRGTSIPVRSDS